MKIIKRIVIIVFCIVLLAPILNFNTERNAISEIDNRTLTENPFASPEWYYNFTSNVENYVNDRIGYRNEMIQAYTVLNDKLFGKMVHPSYTYGKDGYVFGAGISVDDYYNDYHETFADMVKKFQDYCEERNVPFLFVFNPAKPAVLQEYIADGINYNREWVDLFFQALDERGVHYLDNTKILSDATREGIAVFNQKFDANHWNDLGAFYGTNAMLEEVKKDFPNVHVNTMEEIIISEKEETSLLVSKFPINEKIPVVEIRDFSVENLGEDMANEIELDEIHRAFGYYLNEKRQSEGSPDVLVFQGSYMNGLGYKYLQNAFGKYSLIHDYHNVLNFPYYYNIFKPEYVIFEVAEYTFSDNYFDSEKMKTLSFPASYQGSVTKHDDVKEIEGIQNLQVETGAALTEIQFDSEDMGKDVWLLVNDDDYDMIKTDTGYKVTILTEVYNEGKDNMKFYYKK